MKYIVEIEGDYEIIGKYERPQGEWIKKQVTPASCTYVCSECGIEEVILGNFCCWCGAEMRENNT